MRKIFPQILILFCLIVLTGPVAAQPARPDWDALSHYLVFQSGADGDIVPVFHTLVTLASPLETQDTGEIARALSAPGRNAGVFVARLRDPDGSVVYQNLVPVPLWHRGEFHGETPDAPIDGHFFPLETRVFVVRVPALPGTRLQLWDTLARESVTFDLNALPLDRLSPDLSESRVLSATMTGSPANRVDLVIMGDGYTGAQNADFLDDSNLLANNFFTISPLSEYHNYFNVTRLYTESNDSGADHPPYVATGCAPLDRTCCGDPEMQFDPLVNTFKDTAFDAHYCSMNIHRLLEVDYDKVFIAASAVPDWDMLMVIVNDSTYGGSGGSLSVVSTNAANVEIAQHEFGHSFADLADEYSTAYPGYPDCSDKTGSPPCEDNVTDQNVRELIKWAPWILPTTTIPTLPTSPASTDVGLFEGARYKTTGMYRPGQECAMRVLGEPFCPVPEQSLVLSLYEGGWGTPWDGISMVEPGTTSPLYPGVQMGIGESQTFSATVLSPVGGFSPVLIWYLNGIPVASGTNSYHFSATQLDLGMNVIRFEVVDQAGFVHPLMAGDALSSTFDWHVRVGEGIFLPLINH